MSAQTDRSNNNPAASHNHKKKPTKKSHIQSDEQENSLRAVICRMLENGQSTSQLQTSFYEKVHSVNHYLNENTHLQVLVYGTFILGLLPTIVFGVYAFSTFAGVFGVAFLSFCIIQGILLGLGLAILVPVLLTCFGTMLFIIAAFYFTRYTYQVCCRIQYWLENSVNPPTYHSTSFHLNERNRRILSSTCEAGETNQVPPQDELD